MAATVPDWDDTSYSNRLFPSQQEVERLRELLEITIPRTFEYDAKSNGRYDTRLTHEIRSAMGGQSDEA